MKTDIHYWSYLVRFFLEWEIFQTNLYRKSKYTQYVFSNFFRRSCLLWDNVENFTVEWGRTQMTILRMRIACWKPKATNTHSCCVIIISFPLRQWSRERASILRSTLPVLTPPSCIQSWDYKQSVFLECIVIIKWAKSLSSSLVLRSIRTVQFYHWTVNSLSLMYCWPCILVICNFIFQLDALFLY